MNSRPLLRALLGVVLAASLLLPLAAAAGIDWPRYADEDTVEVVTRDADGAPRETTIWLAVVDGQAFIRTGGSRWGENVAREAALLLRVAGEELRVRVEFVEDDSQRQKVTDSMRRKYGLMDRLISPFRGGRPKIMRLHAR